MHVKLWVDNSEFVHAHFARTDCVPKTRRGKSGKFFDLLGACLGPRNEFALTQIVEGTLISKFTGGLNGAHDGREIVIGAKIRLSAGRWAI